MAFAFSGINFRDEALVVLLVTFTAVEYEVMPMEI